MFGSPVSRRLISLAFLLDTSSRSYALFEDFRKPFSQGAYAPHPYAVALAFALIAVLEMAWMKNISRQTGAGGESIDEEEGVFVNSEKPAAGPTRRHVNPLSISGETVLREFVPLYIVGCLCQGNWAMSWLSGNYSLCRLFLTVSAVTQLYAIFAILNGSRNRGLPRRNIAIHLITKSRAARAMLLLWKTWGAVDTVPPPTTTQQVNNMSFLLIFAMSSGPDPTMGFFLVFVLFSLALGPYNTQATVLSSSGPRSGLSNLSSSSPDDHAVVVLVKGALVMIKGGGGWHDTFASSGIIVLVVVLVDWLFARRTRRRAGIRMQASRGGSLSFFPGRVGRTTIDSQATIAGNGYEDDPLWAQDTREEYEEHETYDVDQVDTPPGSWRVDGSGVRHRRSLSIDSASPGEDPILFDYAGATAPKKAQRVLGIRTLDDGFDEAEEDMSSSSAGVEVRERSVTPTPTP